MKQSIQIVNCFILFKKKKTYVDYTGIKMKTLITKQEKNPKKSHKNKEDKIYINRLEEAAGERF